MLPKQYRLKKKSAFSATYKVKNSSRKGGVTLFVGKAKSDVNSITRVGFVVSKKTHKRAVKRNRLRRLMRESYRLLLKNGELANSQNFMSLIFIGGEGALDKDFSQIKNIIKDLLEGIKC